MNWKTTLVSALAVGLLAAGPAPPPTPEPGRNPAKSCFWTHQVTSFASSDDRIVNVRVGVRDVYQFEMFGRCNDVDWTQKIGLVSRGSNYICQGLDAEILSPSTIGPQRCPVRTIRKLSAEEIKALPKRARP